MSSFEKHLKKIAPKLSEVAPGFQVPEFHSDAEEIAWLNKNHERLARLVEKHGVKVKLRLKEPTQQVSIRIPVRDIERAKTIAASRKEPYQAVLKRALRQGLEYATPPMPREGRAS
jgi:predicted DNA binding CopG/RHH family protein